MASFVDVQFHQPWLEAQRQRRPIADRLVEAVAAHVAMGVFHRAKGGEGVAVALVDGRAGQPEEEGVGQRRAHADAKLALLRAVRLVHQHDDVLAGVEQPSASPNLKDGRDDDLAAVLAQQLRQFLRVSALTRLGMSAAWKVALICASRSMRSTAMITVGLRRLGCMRSFCAAKDHEQRFARP